MSKRDAVRRAGPHRPPRSSSPPPAMPPPLSHAHRVGCPGRRHGSQRGGETPRARGMPEALHGLHGRPRPDARAEPRGVAASPTEYVALVPFVDGSSQARCRRDARRPSSRARACAASSSAGASRTSSYDSPSVAESMVIHEILHTLGLGEAPQRARRRASRSRSASRRGADSAPLPRPALSTESFSSAASTAARPPSRAVQFCWSRIGLTSTSSADTTLPVSASISIGMDAVEVQADVDAGGAGGRALGSPAPSPRACRARRCPAS